jgi:uncharacterized membrane protein YcjF (UPF0283 family)
VNAGWIVGGLIVAGLIVAVVMLVRHRSSPAVPQLAAEAAARAKADAARAAEEEHQAKLARIAEDARRLDELKRWETEHAEPEDFLDGRTPLPRPPGGASGGSSGDPR